MVLAFCTGLGGCSYDTRPSSDAIASVRREQQASRPLVSADPTVDPCEDFRRYACNRWIEQHPPRPERPLVGRGFDQVRERSRLGIWDHLSAPGPGEAQGSRPAASDPPGGSAMVPFVVTEDQ